MPYRRNTFDLVVDTGNFNPYQSMQEMLVPFQAYKEAYKETEVAYDTLNKDASTFQYLADRLPEDSKAAQIYQGYANDLKAQADDLARNGLTMGNRRALMNMKRRYNNEIGRLSLADAAMQAEKNRRLANKDTSMLYATDNLDIDDFLDNRNPNLYSVSGNALYTKGAALGKAMADREIHSGDAGSVLGGYYRNWKETKGVAGGDIREFMARPEVQDELNKIMEAEGLDNLTGINRQRAEAQLLSGMATGITYEEKNQLHRDPGVMSASERVASERADRQQKLSAAAAGMVEDETSPTGYRYDPKYDPSEQKNAWMYKYDENGNRVGYSDAYIKAVKEGDITATGKPRNPSTKTEKVDLLENESYDTTTQSSGPAPSGQNATWGAEISKADALELAPNLVLGTGKYSKHYKFYKNGSKITRRRIKSSASADDTDEVPATSTEGETGNGSKHDAL